MYVCPVVPRQIQRSVMAVIGAEITRGVVQAARIREAEGNYWIRIR